MLIKLHISGFRARPGAESGTAGKKCSLRIKKRRLRKSACPPPRADDIMEMRGAAALSGTDGRSCMKITLNQDARFAETEITVCCAEVDEDILRILSMLRVYDRKLTGTKDGDTFIIDARRILYIDSVDRHTFFYTADSVYESTLRLYELEERLGGMDFLRVSKSAIVNFLRIRSIRPDFGGRMRLTMENGEALDVSRQYAGAIREKLKRLEKGEGRG